ncbi:unnamed protein product [Caenorhabditis nigoni]
MDEYDDLGVGDVRREFNEDVANFGASRCSEPADAVREEPEVAEGHDEYEDTDDDEDVRDERRIGGLPPWVVRYCEIQKFRNLKKSKKISEMNTSKYESVITPEESEMFVSPEEEFRMQRSIEDAN